MFRLPSFHFDLISFLLGMLAAGFLLWLSTLLRRYLPTLKGAAAKRTETVKQKKLAGSEEGYRQEIIHIGDRVIDGSIQGRLRDLKDKLLEIA